MEPWEEEQLKSHLSIFPEGQFVAELDGEIIGSCSSLIINFDEYDDRHSWDDVTDKGYITNHNPEGYNLYGIEVMVHPDYRRMKVGQRLYEARKELVQRLEFEIDHHRRQDSELSSICSRNVATRICRGGVAA